LIDAATEVLPPTPLAATVNVSPAYPYTKNEGNICELDLPPLKPVYLIVPPDIAVDAVSEDTADAALTVDQDAPVNVAFSKIAIDAELLPVTRVSNELS
jgi:hypothetical protein